MSDDQDRKHKDDAAEAVCRAVYRARKNGGRAAEHQFDRLVQEWPELAHALSQLQMAHGSMRPEQWKGLRRPGNGWPWAS